MAGGRPTKYNKKEVLKKTLEYIESCNVEEDLTRFTTHEGEEGTSWSHKLMFAKLPTFGRLAFILKVDRDTIKEWRKKYKEFSATCEQLLALQEAKLIEGGASGLYSQSVVNRILAANHGYVDKSGPPQLPPGTTNIQNNFILTPKVKEAMKIYDNALKEDIIEKIKQKKQAQLSPYVPNNTKPNQ